eukprot:c4121_g1_i1 orf=257-538(+)
MAHIWRIVQEGCHNWTGCLVPLVQVSFSGRIFFVRKMGLLVCVFKSSKFCGSDCSSSVRIFDEELLFSTYLQHRVCAFGLCAGPEVCVQVQEG